MKLGQSGMELIMTLYKTNVRTYTKDSTRTYIIVKIAPFWKSMVIFTSGVASISGPLRLHVFYLTPNKARLARVMLMQGTKKHSCCRYIMFLVGQTKLSNQKFWKTAFYRNNFVDQPRVHSQWYNHRCKCPQRLYITLLRLHMNSVCCRRTRRYLREEKGGGFLKTEFQRLVFVNVMLIHRHNYKEMKLTCESFSWILCLHKGTLQNWILLTKQLLVV